VRTVAEARLALAALSAVLAVAQCAFLGREAIRPHRLFLCVFNQMEVVVSSLQQLTAVQDCIRQRGRWGGRRHGGWARWCSCGGVGRVSCWPWGVGTGDAG
jgi:hypothetical protein